MFLAILFALQSLSPIVIGHRGASGLRPEHTLASYTLAIEQGADFIEPDLVITKDGVLVARHENEISGTTDVAAHPEFAARKTTKKIDGVSLEGWFVENFTLAEIKTLRAKERIPKVRPQNVAYDGKFPIPTLQEVIDLARAKSRETGRKIGIYPETKHPSYFQSIGLPLERRLVDVLKANGYAGTDAPPIFIQSFEAQSLKTLRTLTDLPLIQLFGGGAEGKAMATPAGLAAIATYAQGIGPDKGMIVPRDPATGTSLPPTNLVRDAHAAGLKVHPYTLRDEASFRPTDLSIEDETRLLFKLGVDGVFTDYPATTDKIRASATARTPFGKE